MKIILSTRNQTKAKQIKAKFAGSNFSILTLSEARIEGEAIEDGDTLLENALKKARFAHDSSAQKVWTVADDTGLFISHLNGAPGINAARRAGENATTDEITRHTLKQLEGASDRSARFETVVALISPEGTEYFFNGEVLGVILEAPRTAPQPKMPYSRLKERNGRLFSLSF